MNRTIVRLIAAREMRDLLRDRRTVLLILVLPVVLYPLFGFVSILFARTMTEQMSRVGIVGRANLPDTGPALIESDRFITPAPNADTINGLERLTIRFLDGDAEAELKAKSIDVALIIPDDFSRAQSTGNLPTLNVLDRDGDEQSKLATRRLTAVLRDWEDRLRQEKYIRLGLPKEIDRVFVLKDPASSKPPMKQAADELRDTFVKAFPFILMMWLVAGAIQPAVDLTAGEKERGTMETLLISPAERIEIVLGKFIAVSAFTFGSVVWNVIWLAGAALVLERVLGFPIVNLPGLFGCVLLGVPLAMVFSAVCLALGIFARSSKEGQYYLVPLFLVSMPLAFGSMMPGTELTLGNSLIPITGSMLFQQKLLNLSDAPIPWKLLLPVLGSQIIAVVVALALAGLQFRRESVLFRESNR
jgi:sodium transport system permease protein